MERNSKYSEEKIEIGRWLPADNGNCIHTKPDWFDQKKLDRINNIFWEHYTSISMAHLCGLVLIFLYTPIIEPFLFTGKSANIPALLHRYLTTCKHVRNWYDGNLWDPKNSAHKSVVLVRKMHKDVANAIDSPSSGKVAPGGSLFFSQSGMAATQFAFIGWIVAYPEKVGLYCSKEELECLIHLWRCIGYLLGMDDRFNICDGNYEESLMLYQDIIQKNIKRKLLAPRKDGVAMSKDIVTALGREIPLLSWLGLKRYWFEIMELPIDFSLGLHDLICYWWYHLLFNVLLKNSFLRKIVNKLTIWTFEKALNKIVNKKI